MAVELRWSKQPRLGPRRDDSHPKARMLESPYLILYELAPDTARSATVQIIRVLDGRRDLRNVLLG